MGQYQKHLQRHLAAYKHARLGVIRSGTFSYRGRDVARAHILPKELRWLNLLEPFRAEIRAYLSAARDIRLHKYFHHLNSSQAFALNLFYPFFAGGRDSSDAILRAVADGGMAAEWRFEHVPYEKEQTNVDVTWWDENASPTYCEVKLAEADFGHADHDERHTKKLANTYGCSLAPYVEEGLLAPQDFFTNYQVLRNLWLLAKDTRARLVFLLPRQNERLWPALRRVLDRVGGTLHTRVRVQAVEDVLASLTRDPSLEADWRWYAKLLQEKYLPSEGAT